MKNHLVNALLLVGGKSSRMGRDKFSLDYGHRNDHDTQSDREIGMTTIDYFHRLLEKTEVSEIYVSCKKEQQREPQLKKYNLLFDDFKGEGPLIGILSAFKYAPVSWLVIACDLPHIDIDDLFLLFSSRNLNRKKKINKLAYTYYNRVHRRIEPLCTIYEPEIYKIALKMREEGLNCPQKLLWRVEKEIEMIPLLNETKLDNVNTPEDFDRARKIVLGSFEK